MKRYALRENEIKKLAEQFSFIDKKMRIEVLERGNAKLYFTDKLVLIEKAGRIFPSLHAGAGLKCVTVDMGAVPFVCKGADVMRPGITEMPDFVKGELLIVQDEKNKKPLAVVEALFDSETAAEMRAGKIFKNLHYVGDEFWGSP